MFFRLLKYDFRSMLKQFAMIWPAALVLAVINRFTVSSMDSTSNTGEMVAGTAMIVFVAIMIAMFVVSVIFVIQRFFKGLLGDEGYLMHTLPVQTWELILSKLVCAVAVTVISIVIAVVSIIIICSVFMEPVDISFFQVFRWFWRVFDADVLNALVVLAEVFLLFLVGTAQSYLMLYLAMAVGHLFSKNRAAMSVAAYIAIQVIVNTLFGFFYGIFGRSVLHFLNSILSIASWNWGKTHFSLWGMIFSTAAVSAVYFFLTNYILQNKLNLE